MCGMRTRLLSWLLIGVTLFVASSAAQDIGPRLVVVSIDGLMPSSYTNPQSVAKNLRQLASEGAWANGVVGVLPTVTYPSHTTLITGVEPAVHGIVDNRIFDPENKSDGAWYWYARDIKVPTLPMAARARGLRAAAVSWPVTIGMDLDYNVPEYFRSNHPEIVSMIRALSQPRNVMEAAEVFRRKPFGWPQDDRDRTDLALFMLKTFDPHVLLLHVFDLDDSQHRYGPDTPEAQATLAKVDAFVGEVVSAARASGRQPHVAVVSDHGFLPLKTMIQPNAVFKREGLLTVDDRGTITAWQAYFHSSGGAGFVYVKEASQRDRVYRLLQELQKDSANGIREIWTRSELDARGAHPDAAFGLDVVDGFYTGGGHDTLVKPSGSKGGHGFAPDRTALHASFIIAGPSVAHRGSLGTIRMTRIAPTLARILGVGLSPQAAPPLDVLSGMKD